MHDYSPIAALNDNYIWAIVHSQNRHLAIVDPGAAQPVLDFINNNDLTLTAILITHHHADHVGGIKDLLKTHPVPVYGPATEVIPSRDLALSDGDDVHLSDLDLELKILGTPGHTLGQIAYYNDEVLFCGDTLFAAGCGKVFEGTPAQMVDSLNKFAALADDTKVYCGHEYTVANLQFAQLVEPNNEAIKQRLVSCIELREMNMPTLPSTIGLEKQTNPFLRCNEKEVIKAANEHSRTPCQDETEVFAAIRQWKNNH